MRKNGAFPQVFLSGVDALFGSFRFRQQIIKELNPALFAEIDQLQRMEISIPTFGADRLALKQDAMAIKTDLSKAIEKTKQHVKTSKAGKRQ